MNKPLKVNKPTEQNALQIYHELCDYLQMFLFQGYKINESSISINDTIIQEDAHIKSLVDSLASNITKPERSELMVQTEEFLGQVVLLQKRAAKRGLELIYAAGAKREYYATPDFEFTGNGVSMRFGEDTNHDCPESESITLTTAELVMTETEWAAKIEQVKADTKRKKEEKEQKERDETLAQKREQLEKLKAELGE